MKALVNYEVITYGCQRNEKNEMVDWIGSGSEHQVVEFEPDENYSDTINAIKALPPLNNNSNTYTSRVRFKVTVLN